MMAAGAVVVAMVISVADGDTLTLKGGTVVRIEGIAAPERKEPFGGASADALRSIALGHEATCTAAGHQSWGREVMSCTVDGADIGTTMILVGKARPCHVHVQGERRYPQAMERAGAVPRELPGYCR